MPPGKLGKLFTICPPLLEPRCPLHGKGPLWWPHREWYAATCVGCAACAVWAQNSLRFYKDVAYDRTYRGLVTDDNEGKRLAQQLGGKMTLLHRCHGPIVTGESVAAAFDNLYYLERAAMIQVLTMASVAAGGNLCVVDEETAAHTKQQIDTTLDENARAHLGARLRELERTDRAAAGPAWPHAMALLAAAAVGALGTSLLLRQPR